MTDDYDEIILKSGKKYACSKIVGISLHPHSDEIYYGHDGVIGEFQDDGLTKEDKLEIARMMILRWSKFLQELHKT